MEITKDNRNPRLMPGMIRDEVWNDKGVTPNNSE